MDHGGTTPIITFRMGGLVPEDSFTRDLELCAPFRVRPRNKAITVAQPACSSHQITVIHGRSLMSDARYLRSKV